MFNKGTVIAVTSRKGGVGKTTSVLNLAGCYNALGLKTLILDFDLVSGGVAVSLNLKPKKTVYNLAIDIERRKYKKFEDYVLPYTKNIDVLAAPIDPREGIKLDSSLLLKIINYARLKYDVVIMDTNHVVTSQNLFVLDQADYHLYIITNDPIDLKNTASMMKIYKENEFGNYFIILNEARDTGKDYYTPFDIRKIIGDNIDYIIPKSFYIRDIDKYTTNGHILFLNRVIRNRYKKEFEAFLKIAKTLVDYKGDGKK